MLELEYIDHDFLLSSADSLLSSAFSAAVSMEKATFLYLQTNKLLLLVPRGIIDSTSNYERQQNQKHSIYVVKAEYLRGHGVARHHSGGDQEEPADIDKVDTAINSKRFLGMLIMVDMLATLVLMMAHWADSCCCHMKIPGQHAFSTREKRSYWKRLLKGVVFFPTCFVTLRQIRFNF